MIVLWFGDRDAPLANPTQIAGIVTDDILSAIQILGLTRIEPSRWEPIAPIAVGCHYDLLTFNAVFSFRDQAQPERIG